MKSIYIYLLTKIWKYGDLLQRSLEELNERNPLIVSGIF